MKIKQLVIPTIIVAASAFSLMYILKRPLTNLKNKIPSAAIPLGLPKADVPSAPQSPYFQSPTAIQTIPRKNNPVVPIPIDPKINQLELQQLRKLTDENSKSIFAKMKNDEIISLQASIENDERLLKFIETKGSGIEDYKYIEKNLATRKERLKTLQHKK